MKVEVPPSENGNAAPDEVAATESVVSAPSIDSAVKVGRRRNALVFIISSIFGLMTALVAVVVGMVYFDLERAPFVGRFLRDRIVSALQERIDPAMRLSIDDVDVRRVDHETIVEIAGFRVRDITSRSLIFAPKGRIQIATAPLLGFRIVPTSVTLSGLHAEIEVSEAGTIMLGENGATEAIEKQPETAPQKPLERMQRLIGGAFAGLAAMRESVGGRLPDVGIDRASLTILDRRLGQTFKFSDLSSRMTTAHDGAANARVEFKGQNGPLSATLHLSPPDGQRQRFVASADNLKFGDLLAQFGTATTAVDPSTPISFRVNAEVDGEIRARSANAEIRVGKSILDLDRKMAPVPLEKALLRFDWAEGQGEVTITELSGISEGSNVKLSGTIVPPVDDSAGWQIRLNNAGSSIEPLARSDKPLKLDSLSGLFTAFPDKKTINIDRIDIASGKGRGAVSGRVYLGEDNRPGLDLEVKVVDADARLGMRLWPGFAATDVRKWLTTNVKSGLVNSFDMKLEFPPDVLEAALADRPLPQKSLAMAFSVSGGVLQPLPHSPLVQNIIAEGVGNGRSITVEASSASVEPTAGRRLALSDGTFTVADISKKPADGQLKFNVSGLVEAALDFVKAPGIQPFVPKGIDNFQAKGLIEGDVAIGMKISPKMTPNDARVSLSAQLKNLMIDKGIGGEKIEGGTFQLNLDKDVLTLKGDAKLFGTSAAIEVKGTGRAPAVANVTLTMDDAARARKGINLGPSVKGPATVRFSTKLDGENEDVSVEVDLSRLAISHMGGAISKKAGVPGRLKGMANEIDGGGWELDKMELDAGIMSARGQVRFGADGHFVRAQLTNLKLSQGDVMQVDAERAGNAFKLNVRGNSVDARPFLRQVLTGGIEKSGGGDIDLTLKSTVISGFNGEVVSGADVKLAMRGGGLQRFDLTGRFDGGPITAKLQPSAKMSALVISTADAGAFFRFFDIYNRMRGGTLQLNAQMGGSSQTGTLGVRDFVLRDEPAMRKLVADNAGQASGDTARLQPDPIRRLRNAQDVPFSRMNITFARTPGRLDIREGVLIGPEIGGNISGKLDYARDQVELTGTFVPAFSLNNMVARVPIVGPIVAGGRNEGLFAVRYNITGKASAPTLGINPLTAIAPGFLRRLIDFQGAGSNAPAERPEQ